MAGVTRDYYAGFQAGQLAEREKRKKFSIWKSKHRMNQFGLEFGRDYGSMTMYEGKPCVYRLKLSFAKRSITFMYDPKKGVANGKDE